MAEKSAGAAVEAAPAPQLATTSSADEARKRARHAEMRDILAKQPKVRIRISKEEFGHETFVGINGYKFQIQNGVSLEVPEQVADLLVKMGRI